MRCPNCQKDIPEGGISCPNCGAPLVTNAMQAPEATIPNQETEITETVAAPMPEIKALPKITGANKLYLSFNEKPAAIVQIMDEAQKNETAFVAARMRQLHIFAWLVPAGVLFFVLDWWMKGGFISLALVAYVCWGIAVGGLFFLWRDRAFTPELAIGTDAEKQKRSRSIGGTIFTVVFLTIWGLGFFGGISFMLYEFVGSVFPIAAAVVVIILTIAYLTLWKRRVKGGNFGSKFVVARTVFEIVKDDVSPKRTFIGWLDLTGVQQPGKLFHEKRSQSGMPVGYYRDEWLRLKAPLYDGSLLRLSAVERTKARLGRWKVNLRGKHKWKPGGVVQAREILSLAVIPNPETHRLAPDIPVVNLESNVQVGNFYIQNLLAQNGRLECEAVSYKPVEAWDLLQVMRYAHDFVKPLPGQPG